MGYEAVDNSAASAAGGAGIQAAQLVVAQGVEAIVGGNVGPNAISVLQAANVPLYLFDGGSVRQAVEAFKKGELREAMGASVADHSGMARATRSDPASKQARESDVNELRKQAAALRQQLVTLIERIEALERADR